MIVVSDTTPLNYLVLIDETSVLQEIFGRVIVPPAVFGELQQPGSPERVRVWASSAPPWLEVRSPVRIDPTINLGRGESEAISLAQELGTALVLIDDMKARKVALARGLSVAGTLSILAEAAERGLLDLPQAVERFAN